MPVAPRERPLSWLLTRRKRGVWLSFFSCSALLCRAFVPVPVLMSAPFWPASFFLIFFRFSNFPFGLLFVLVRSYDEICFPLLHSTRFRARAWLIPSIPWSFQFLILVVWMQMLTQRPLWRNPFSRLNSSISISSIPYIPLKHVPSRIRSPNLHCSVSHLRSCSSTWARYLWQLRPSELMLFAILALILIFFFFFTTFSTFSPSFVLQALVF